jgi:hypothetical protein
MISVQVLPTAEAVLDLNAGPAPVFLSYFVSGDTVIDTERKFRALQEYVRVNGIDPDPERITWIAIHVSENRKGEK